MGVHDRLDRSIPPGSIDHFGQGVALEVFAHVVADVGPNGEENALALVVACAVLVGIAEVASLDGSVDRTHDLRESDQGWISGQHVASTDTSF